MKSTIRLALIVALIAPLTMTVGCAHLRESDDIDPIIHGTWSGEGRFYDRDLNEEYGTFAVAFEVHADGTVSGKVGSANLTGGVIKSRPEDYLVEAELVSDVFAGGSLPGERKDRVVFILEPPASTAAGTNGDFHLKTNLAFDISMRAGALTLTRSS